MLIASVEILCCWDRYAPNSQLNSQAQHGINAPFHGDRYKMINHFKPTDRNAFIPLESCNHNRWLCNFPRGQNCTQEEDFVSQSQVLSTRFQQKGYDRSILDNEIEKVRNMDRNTLIFNVPNVNQNTTTQIRMILDFSVQHKKFEKIVDTVTQLDSSA